MPVLPLLSPSASRCLALLAVLLLSGPAQAAAPQTPLPDKALERIVHRCNTDPAYRLGGAAIIDCLQEQDLAVEKRIARQLESLSGQHCAVIGHSLARQQQAWQDYRHHQCGLYSQLFDNTAMAVNAAVCRLRMGLQRAHELDQLADLQPGSPLPCEWTPALPPVHEQG